MEKSPFPPKSRLEKSRFLYKPWNFELFVPKNPRNVEQGGNSIPASPLFPFPTFFKEKLNFPAPKSQISLGTALAQHREFGDNSVDSPFSLECLSILDKVPPIFYCIRRGNFPIFFLIFPNFFPFFLNFPYFFPIFSPFFPQFSPNFFPTSLPFPEQNIYEYLNIFGMIPLFPGNSPHPEAGVGIFWDFFFCWVFIFWGEFFCSQRGKFGNCGGNFAGGKEDSALPGNGNGILWDLGRNSWNSPGTGMETSLDRRGTCGIFMEFSWNFHGLGTEPSWIWDRTNGIPLDLGNGIFPDCGMDFMEFSWLWDRFNGNSPGFGTESMEFPWIWDRLFLGLGNGIFLDLGWNPWKLSWIWDRINGNSPGFGMDFMDFSRVWGRNPQSSPGIFRGFLPWNFPGFSPLEFSGVFSPGIFRGFSPQNSPGFGNLHFVEFPRNFPRVRGWKFPGFGNGVSGTAVSSLQLFVTLGAPRGASSAWGHLGTLRGHQRGHLGGPWDTPGDTEGTFRGTPGVALAGGDMGDTPGDKGTSWGDTGHGDSPGVAQGDRRHPQAVLGAPRRPRGRWRWEETFGDSPGPLGTVPALWGQFRPFGDRPGPLGTAMSPGRHGAPPRTTTPSMLRAAPRLDGVRRLAAGSGPISARVVGRCGERAGAEGTDGGAKMVLESTMVCVDNSEYMRNGDFLPTRLQAQQDAVNIVCHSKTRSNPENNVGLITLAK
uniref:VWFA domain-containing protein n=1 Tax=Junco hyemalis TaxID=40217 RepID=A0A8C5IF91_JUNHY